MSSPFSWFRRKQKILLAVFGILIIFSFTVGGIVTSYQRQHMGSGGGTDVVVTWKEGKVSEADLRTMRVDAHMLTLRFLDRVVQETRARDGWPKAPGVTRSRYGQIVDPGIPRSSQEEDLVHTMLMAQKARDMGMEVTEEGIWEFLHLLCDDKFRRPDLGQFLREATGDEFSRRQLFGQLQTELLAQNLERVIRSGLMAMPPDQVWDYFNRFTRELTAEVLPIKVADYTSEVKGAPTVAEVKQLYEEAKDRYPDPDSPEPGFKRRKKIAFQYLKIEYHKFLEQEKAAVPMEQVEKYYEENKNDFKVPELPPAEDEKPEAKPAGEDDGGTEGETGPKKSEGKEQKTEPGEDSGAKPASPDEMGEGKAAVTTSKDDASEVPDTETDAGDAPSKEVKPSPDATGEASADEKPEAPPKTKPPTETGDPNKETPEPPAKTDTSTPDVNLVPPKNKPADSGEPKSEEDARVVGPEDTVFVSFAAEPEPKDAEDATEAESEGKDAKDATKTEPEAKDAGDVTEAKTDAEKPVELPGDDVAEKPKSKDDATSEASPPPAPKEKADKGDAATADKDATAKDGDAAEKEKPVEYQPLEDVEDQIRSAIASPIAEEKKKKAFEAAERKVELYFGERIRWESMVKAGLKATEPPPLDHEALAEQLNLTAGETPLLDEIEIGDFELGESYLFQGGQRISFPQIAYMEDLPLFKPNSIPSSEWNVDFLYWKIEEEDWKTDDGEDRSVPELDEIRDEVEDAWRRIEALKLARTEAERLAKKAKGDESLKASLDEEKAKEVVETGKFAWMTDGATPMGFGLPRLSSVGGVELAGADFMEAVFALNPGETGVAVNQPQSVVYLVRVVSESPNVDQRKKEFMEQRGSMFAIYPHMARVQEVMADWQKDLEREMEVEWQRPPEIYTTQ